MTYKQGCSIAALLGIPALVFDLLVRLPPLYHMRGAHELARILLFPGWQLAGWLTGGVMGRTFEYKLLVPLFVLALNVLAWGGLVWWCANVWQMLRTRRSSSHPRES
jgi:hypothetical protein